MTAPARHAPVMEVEAVAALAPVDCGVYVDATLGGGGYTRAILAARETRVFAFDRDPTAIERARAWARAYEGRLTLIGRPFADIGVALDELGVEAVDGVVFDLGVSSMQFDEADRGFSFLREGPLSMRMDAGRPDAADVVAAAEVSDLAEIFRAYGEEKRAGPLARAVVRAREASPILTTSALADIIAQATPMRLRDRIHPATRAFQALRIFVNDELGQIADALVAAERMLRPAGRLAVVTFHSLEDRIVKRFFVDRAAAGPTASRHAPDAPGAEPSFQRLYTKPLTPTEAEIAGNPRARSAKLRAGVRTNAPARSDQGAFAPRPLRLSKSFQRWSDA